MKCKDCKFKMNIANTEQSRQAICSFPNSYSPVCIDNDCLFIREAFKCKDCESFYYDSACLAKDEEDKPCSDFMSIGESKIVETLIELLVNGLYSRGRINDILNRFEQETQPRYEELLREVEKSKEVKNGK